MDKFENKIHPKQLIFTKFGKHFQGAKLAKQYYRLNAVTGFANTHNLKRYAGGSTYTGRAFLA
jgi:hypothetical protein